LEECLDPHIRRAAVFAQRARHLPVALQQSAGDLFHLDGLPARGGQSIGHEPQIYPAQELLPSFSLIDIGGLAPRGIEAQLRNSIHD
jgi:hypothetical protein